MENQEYLIFNLDDLQYGISTDAVQEIFWLPEITPIAEAPLDTVGILNIDLNNVIFNF